MDELDKKILNILQNDDKTPYFKIGEELGIGTSTVHFRVKKIIKAGIIERFSAIVEPEKVGYNATAWLGLSVDARKMDNVAKKIAKFPEVQLVATSTGDHDLVVQIVAPSEKDIWRFVNQHIKTMDEIEKDFDVSTFLDIFKRTSYVPME